MRRYVVTGAPGAGKTALVKGLEALGYGVVDEAATDFIAGEQRRGISEPWTSAQFLDGILHIQMERQMALAPVLVFDRSPICTLALARYSGCPVPPRLHREIDRLIHEKFYERQVFFVRSLGFIELTAVRRITLKDSRVFEAIHESTYRELGFDLVDVPVGSIERRVATVDETIKRLAEARGRKTERREINPKR